MINHKPCPFCGNEDVDVALALLESGAWIECPGCGSTGPYAEAEPHEEAADRAWELWNERAGDER